MSDTYNPNESGINPVDSATGSKDIYFSNEDFSKKIKEEKSGKHNCYDFQKQYKKEEIKRCNFNLSVFYYCYCCFNADFRLCDFLP